MLSSAAAWLPTLLDSRRCSLSSTDVAILRECERLMPQGPLSQDLVVRDDSLPTQPVDIIEELSVAVHTSPAGASPSVRRAADAVLDELRHYFDVRHSAAVPCNARSVLGGRLACFALEMVHQREEMVAEAVQWWCEFLLRIEDTRPFTRSNWINASGFEETLSRCRLILLELSGRLREASGSPALQRLREQLREAHSTMRHAADNLLELLYIGLRARPAIERCSFHELQRLAKAGRPIGAAFEAAQDRLVFYVLLSEEQHSADDLAPAFLTPFASPATDQEHCADLQLKKHDQDASDSTRREVEALLRRFQADSPAVAKIVGEEATAAFVELHGLYCLFVALLQRLELCLQAVSEYARFVCFLPVYRAALLDLQDHLPQLRRRVTEGINTLAAAYERLPRSTAPPGRAAVLEKCRCIAVRLEQSARTSETVLSTLKACTPQETLQEFEVWRHDDHRWAKLARLRLASKALLPASQIEALEVPSIVDSLASGGRQLSPRASVSVPSASSLEADAVVQTKDSSSLASFGLAGRVGEGTRLHVAACSLAVLGQQAWEEALHPGCKWTAQACSRQLQALLDRDAEGKAARLVGDIAARVRPVHAQDAANLCAAEWVLVSDAAGDETIAEST